MRWYSYKYKGKYSYLVSSRHRPKRNRANSVHLGKFNANCSFINPQKWFASVG